MSTGSLPDTPEYNDVWNYPYQVQAFKRETVLKDPEPMQASPLSLLMAYLSPKETEVVTVPGDLPWLTLMHLTTEPIPWVRPKRSLLKSNLVTAAQRLKLVAHQETLTTLREETWFLQDPKRWPTTFHDYLRRKGLGELAPWEVALVSFIPTRQSLTYTKEMSGTFLLSLGLPEELLFELLEIPPKEVNRFYLKAASALTKSLWFQLWFHSPAPETFLAHPKGPKPKDVELALAMLRAPWRYTDAGLKRVLGLGATQVKEAAFGFRNPAWRTLPPSYILKESNANS